MLQKNTFYHHQRQALYNGMKDALPIGLGYLAVSFSLGIAARNAGLNAFQGFLASFFNNASAGEYAGFTMIKANATYLELALATLIANARYLLMSCALSQKIPPTLPFFHRFLIAFDVTDELFAINVSRPGGVNPAYTYGSFLVALPCWAFGTSFGVIAGNILPLRVTSALSVALYGMFLAVVIPPSKNNKILAGLVGSCFLLSFIASKLPALSSFSEGTRIIILTVLIASIAAILFPVNTTKEGQNDA